MLGNVRRWTDYPQKSVKNPSFQAFCKEFNHNIKQEYGYCDANTESELPSIAKYDREQPDLDPACWAVSGEWMRIHFAGMKGSSELSVAQAWSEMPKTTSPGYPSSIKYPKKSDLVTKVPEWFNYLEEMKRKLADPDVTGPFIWTCSVKAEMRPIEKKAQNKLRTFLASPADHSTLLNSLCLDMNNRFYELGQSNKVWSAVGMSKYGRGWHRLAERLGIHPSGFALDGERFDSSVLRRSLMDICKFRCECLNATLEQQNRLKNLYVSIIESVIVLTNGDIVMKDTGNPSGSVNTVVDNTLHLFRLLAYAWLKCAPPNKRTYGDFMDNVEAALYGDDNTFTVSQEAQVYFNARSVQEALKGILTVTAEDDVWEARPLNQLRFLSQKFTYNTEYSSWVPEPIAEKVLNSLEHASTVNDVRWHLLRAYMLLIDGYWNERARQIIKDYIWYLYKENKMEDGEVAKGVMFRDIQALNRTDENIRHLYNAKQESLGFPVFGEKIQTMMNEVPELISHPHLSFT